MQLGYFLLIDAILSISGNLFYGILFENLGHGREDAEIVWFWLLLKFIFLLFF